MVCKRLSAIFYIPVAVIVLCIPLYGKCEIQDQLPLPSLAPITNLQTGLTPLILIHGNAQELTSRCAGWEPFIESALAHPDFSKRYSVYLFLHDTSKPIGFDGNGNAKELGDLITTRFGIAQSIGIVAHSRGGLVARAYMNRFGSQQEGERIFSLITLGTPHHGTPPAVPDWGLSTFRHAYKVNTSCFVNLFYNTTSDTTDICKVRLRVGLVEVTVTYRDTPQFNVNRAGSMDLAWNNFDNPPFGIPLETGFKLINATPAIPLSLGNVHTLSSRDGNVAHPNEDKSTDADLHGLVRTSFLDEFNGNERYAKKISAYGGFYSDPSRNTALVDLLAAKLSGTSTKHTELSWAGRILQSFRSRGSSLPLYVANDGLVPLQSALFLRAGTEPIYQHETDPFFQSRKSVSRPLVITDLSGMTTTKRIRIYRDFDHLDILEKSFNDVVADLDADLSTTGISKWTQVFPMTSPSSRGTGLTGATMVYDEARGEIVLFGGAAYESSGVTFLDETWVWKNQGWQRKLPNHHPPARMLHGLAYDTARRQAVLFGGQNGSVLDDTWVWDGSDWIQRSPSNKPAARTHHGMTYDRARGRVVVYGGQSVLGYFADTWEWNGVNWSLMDATSIAGAREYPAIGYDEVAQTVMMFGGAPGALGGTFQWNGTVWAEKVTTVSPINRAAAALVTHPQSGRPLLFGGLNPTDPSLQSAFGRLYDTWLWTGNIWEQQNSLPMPPSLSSSGIMATDRDRKEVVLLITPDANMQAQTWIWK